MLKEERHQYILNRINQNYRIYITALSSELGVSDDTYGEIWQNWMSLVY